MIAKLIVWDRDRELATARMLRALGEYEIGGLTTLIPFHEAILQSEQWARAETCRDLIEDRQWLKGLAGEQPEASGEEGEEPAEPRTLQVEVDGKLFEVRVFGAPQPDGGGAAGAGLRRPPKRERGAAGSSGVAGETLTSPLQGTVLRVAVEQGQQVEEGGLVCVIEAMKMENEITAHRSGEVAELNVSEGRSVASGETIAVIR